MENQQKIPFDEALTRKEWLHREIMSSLTNEVFKTIEEKGFDRTFDIELEINGISVSPKLYNDIMNNVEKYINREAALLAAQQLVGLEEKFAPLQEHLNQLQQVFVKSIDSIANDFNVEIERD